MHNRSSTGIPGRYRGLWKRYCNAVNGIVFVVDSSDRDKFDTAKEDLKYLMSLPLLVGIPFLVLWNKSDLADAVSEDELIKIIRGLEGISLEVCCCYSVSVKNNANLDKVLEWIIQRAP